MKNNKNIMIFACLFGIAVSVSGQTTLISTLGSTAGNDWNVGSSAFSIAEEFITSTQSENIGTVSFDTGNLYGSGDPLTLSFYSNASGEPGSLLSNGTLTGPASLTNNSFTTFDASGLTLSANTTYWLVFTNSSSIVQIKNRQGDSLVTSSSVGWTLGNFGYLSEGSGNPYTFGYTGIAEPLFSIMSVPEPGSVALIGLGLVGLIAFRRRV